MTRNFDAIVIGTGQAGPFLAVRIAAACQRVVIIERGRVQVSQPNILSQVRTMD